jgi:hypothetical protein
MGQVDTTALALCITFPILAIISVLGRFHARYLKKVSIALDDWVVVVSLVLARSFS